MNVPCQLNLSLFAWLVSFELDLQTTFWVRKRAREERRTTYDSTFNLASVDAVKGVLTGSRVEPF